ncbi:hypothetical protein KR067_003904, partial [Drosophila pandora]
KMFYIFLISVGFSQILQSHTRPVLILNPASLDEYLDHGDVLLEYYSPPCNSCSRTPSSLDNLGDSLNSSTSLTLAAIDCEEHFQYCLKKKIRRYPQLSYIKRSSGKMENTNHIKELFDFMAQYNISIKTFEVASLKFPQPHSPFPSAFCVPGHVFYLKPNRFYSSISKGRYFIKFFSPYCIFCKRFEPKWRDLAANMANVTSLCIAEYDCTSGMDICKELNTTRVPSLVWFEDGKLVKTYKGARHASQLELFIGEMMGDYNVLARSRSHKIINGNKLILFMLIINILYT